MDGIWGSCASYTCLVPVIIMQIVCDCDSVLNMDNITLVSYFRF